MQLGPPSATAGGWFGEISGGVIHLGRGLLGEGVQNEVHRVVGAERVSLPYLESDRWVGSATLRGGRALPVAAPWSLEVEGEVHLAPAFRSWQNPELRPPMSKKYLKPKRIKVFI